MKGMMTLERPNQFMDSMTLQEWALEFHKDIFEKWEYSLDDEGLGPTFWAWLNNHYPDILSEFKKSVDVT